MQKSLNRYGENMLEIKTFEELLNENTRIYDSDKWYYSGNDDTVRYILGEKNILNKNGTGSNPLIVIGINLSTAKPDDLDNTIKRVAKKAKEYGKEYGIDSYIMMNVYPQRAKNPKFIHKQDEYNSNMHLENLNAFEYVFKNIKEPKIWAAWGSNIKKRKFLKECLKDIVLLLDKYNVVWMKRGNWKHPHHPLYLSDNYKLEKFDINEYIIKKLK